MYPYKRDTEGGLIEIHREEGDLKTKPEIGVMQPHAQEYWGSL